MKKLFSLFALTAILSCVALADIAPPSTPKPAPKGKQVQLMVNVTNEVTEPTLVIKKSSTKLLRAALDEAEGIENNSAQIETAKPNSSAAIQTVIGGMFLTLALVFGGVWFARGKKPSKTAIGLFLIGIFTTATVLVVANVAPPKSFGINKYMLSPDFHSFRSATARGNVRVKIIDDKESTDDVKLLIPREEKSSGGE